MKRIFIRIANYGDFAEEQADALIEELKNK